MNQTINEEYLIELYDKNRGPQKKYKFYVTLASLYKTKPNEVKTLINKVNEWGYWKDLFILLLANDNIDLENYIYTFTLNQLKEDWNNYMKKETISNLAKWIPKQNKSFDKKLKFVENMCMRLYPDYKEFPFNCKKRYRKMTSTLNKYLGTTEIYLCSKEYEKIDFDRVSNICMKRNMNTFLKDDNCKNNLRKHLYKKYVSLDFKNLLDKIIFKKISDFEKEVIKEVWKINRIDYEKKIEQLVGMRFRSIDIVIDMSKSMYDSKNINISIGVALLGNVYNNKIIINAYNPYILELKYDLFENIDIISQECVSYDSINLEKISQLMNKKKILFVTSKDMKIYKSDIIVTCWNIVNSNIKKTVNNNITIVNGNIYRIEDDIKNRNSQIIKDIIKPNSNVGLMPYFYYFFLFVCCLFLGYMGQT